MGEGISRAHAPAYEPKSGRAKVGGPRPVAYKRGTSIRFFFGCLGHSLPSWVRDGLLRAAYHTKHLHQLNQFYLGCQPPIRASSRNVVLRQTPASGWLFGRDCKRSGGERPAPNRTSASPPVSKKVQQNW